MILNEAKGSYGMFSRAGKNCHEKHHILTKKDQILNGNKKKSRKLNDFFRPDDTDQSFESDEMDERELINENYFKNERFVPLIIEKKGQSESIPKKQRSTKKEYKITQTPKLDNPPCTRYNPKYNYVWKNNIFSLDWNSSVRQNFSIKQLIDDVPKREASYSNRQIEKKATNLSKTAKKSFFSPKPLSKIKTDQNSQIIKERKNSSILLDSEKKKMMKSGPDFRRTMPRFKKSHSNEKFKRILPNLTPNYEAILERPKFVKFDKSGDKKTKNISNFIENFNKDYDIDKIIEKVNNHKRTSTPNLKLMSSRPNGNLPSYMQKIYNRQSSETFTDFSLKQNNWENSKFQSKFSGFEIKKSYNSLINMNLQPREKSLVEKYVKGFKIRSKDLNEHINEGLRHRFDNITFKSFNRKSQLNYEEMEKKLIKYTTNN